MFWTYHRLMFKLIVWKHLKSPEKNCWVRLYGLGRPRKIRFLVWREKFTDHFKYLTDRLVTTKLHKSCTLCILFQHPRNTLWIKLLLLEVTENICHHSESYSWYITLVKKEEQIVPWRKCTTRSHIRVPWECNELWKSSYPIYICKEVGSRWDTSNKIERLY